MGFFDFLTGGSKQETVATAPTTPSVEQVPNRAQEIMDLIENSGIKNYGASIDPIRVRGNTHQLHTANKYAVQEFMDKIKTNPDSEDSITWVGENGTVVTMKYGIHGEEKYLSVTP